VEVVDEVLDLLEGDERWRFTLDGQLATADDYLEIRPEAAERIRRLVESGRLAIGPWQTLVDEFLVSGETIVRNLEAGRERAEDFGGAMEVGYLPDMFGHVAQMPQILRAAGIGVAALWRGVPAEVDSHVFAWEAPDGSVVRVEYLPEGGYSNAAWAFDPGGEGLDAVLERLRPWFDDDTILGMVGTDHMPPVRELPDRIPPDARIGTLAEYLKETGVDGLRRIRGELRSAARANLLPNVVSARIDIKQACGRAERALERYAEPLQALYGGDWPDAFLRVAWSRLFQNAAHDSVCGCSADAVSAQVLVRYAEAEQIADELTRKALARIAAQAPSGSVVVVNPSPFQRTEVVELEGAVEQVTVPPLGWAAVHPGQVQGSGPWTGPEDTALPTTRIVRGGDAGDSYNYAPPSADVLVDEPEEERLETVEDGPLRRIVVLHRTYRWDGRLVATETRFEQRAVEPFVRVRISFDNPCDDQRVRVHVPLPEGTDRTHAEGQFAVVERPPLQEGGHGEHGLGAYPASAFVAAGGVALLFEHAAEYELIDDRELAVTVLRSVGLISRAANSWREENAGPELPIPDAQMHGPHSFSFAWCPDPERALEHAERYRHPLLTVKGTGGDDARESQAGPELTGAVLTSLRRRDGRLEARIVNETGAARQFSFGAERGELRPWEIRTLTL
jgi:hypothetical protein